MDQISKSRSAARAFAVTLALLTAGLAARNARAAEDFCGRPSGEPAALLEQISKADGIKEIFRGPEYVAYQEASTGAVFTFTEPGQGEAHPAAVCRKPQQQGDSIVLQMVIVCRGAPGGCQRLESDFKLLNAKMEAAIRSEKGEPAKP